MRGVKAKRLRRATYGEASVRQRGYVVLTNGESAADDRRKTYQQAKRRGGQWATS